MSLTRRRLLLAAPATLIARPALAAPPPDGPLDWAMHVNMWAHRLVVGDALAREYPESSMSPEFRTNGNVASKDAEWVRGTRNGFADYRLRVEGLVNQPGDFSLEALKSMPSRTQITRHDCVEGWSAIGKWTGVPLSEVLDRVGVQDRARYVVFWCYDGVPGFDYYESIDMRDAMHPQTILAYGMNDETLPTGHGAPLRLRVERQLGYKHAKFIRRIELTDDLSKHGNGGGGYWEDLGNYWWYAGI